jgi:hypothetical protein
VHAPRKSGGAFIASARNCNRGGGAADWAGGSYVTCAHGACKSCANIWRTIFTGIVHMRFIK